METYDLSKLTAQDFKDHLGQTLNIEFANGEAVSASVEKITELETYSPLERGAFSVVLQTPGDQSPRQQGIYTLLHPQSGPLEVFLVPIARDKGGVKYEAVFS